MNWYKIANKQPWEMTQSEFSEYQIPLIKDEKQFPQLRYVRELFERNNIEIQEIGVTGSQSAGVSTPNSDIDIYVKVPDDQYNQADDLAQPLIHEGIDVLINWRGTGVSGGIERGTKTHLRLIQKALSEGKNIPHHVLEEYKEFL
jgi:predicted nucleotidyltransferase